MISFTFTLDAGELAQVRRALISQRSAANDMAQWCEEIRANVIRNAGAADKRAEKLTARQADCLEDAERADKLLSVLQP